jgi:hypothetical protein
MNFILGTSWKTSLWGYLFAIAQVVVPMVLGGPVTIGAVMTAVGTAIIGRVAKDADQTGMGR